MNIFPARAVMPRGGLVQRKRFGKIRDFFLSRKVDKFERSRQQSDDLPRGGIIIHGDNDGFVIKTEFDFHGIAPFAGMNGCDKKEKRQKKKD